MGAEGRAVRSWGRGTQLTRAQRLALAAVLVALGVVLSTLSIPVGPARVSPTQHLINVVAGVLLGPWYAVLTAFGISVLRNGLGTGTFLAFPGSIFGALLVGLVYHRVRRTDLAAFAEPVGTALIGGLVGYLLILPVTAPTRLLGFIPVNPAPTQAYLDLFTGPLFLVVAFAVSSIPGSVLGFVVLKALRAAGVGLAERPRASDRGESRST